MNTKINPPKIADEECILDAAEIVTGEEYADHRPIEHLENPAVRDELKRAGFSHAMARVCRYRTDSKILSLD